MTSAPEPTTAEDLNPSKLGTKEYWDQAYTLETHNFTQDPSDIGQIWFSESNAESRILSYLSRQSLPPTTSFLDLGTGNGHLLFEILDTDDYPDGTFVGIDYSPQAMTLARKIAAELGVEEKVRFEVADCVKDELKDADWVPERGQEQAGFDVVLDKGTFDAISLSGEVLGGGTGRRLWEGYREKVVGVVKRGGWLVVTSCNWTEGELRGRLEGGELEYHGRIEYPSFSFGGKTGQAISSVCFRRK